MLEGRKKLAASISGLAQCLDERNQFRLTQPG